MPSSIMVRTAAIAGTIAAAAIAAYAVVTLTATQAAEPDPPPAGDVETEAAPAPNRGPVAHAWGSDRRGYLGVGSPGGTQADPTPLGMPPDVFYAQVAAGARSSCALDDDGGVWCWGFGQSGQLGDGQGQSRSDHRPVDADVRLTSLAGHDHSFCGIDTAGALWCWGSNRAGQLGVGDTDRRTVPTKVVGGSWAEVDVARTHTCAVDTAGDGWCWGRGGVQGWSPLGTGNTSNTTTPAPVVVPDGTTLAGIAAGSTHSAAVDTDGRVWAWGEGRSGQIGPRETTAMVAVEVPLPDGVVAVNVTAGDDHTCVIDQDGGVWCWGRGREGQLGVGARSDSADPVQVELDAPAVTVDAGSEHTCVVDGLGDVWCWGEGGSGRLGTGDASVQDRPVRVDLPWDAAGVTAGDDHTVGWPAR